MKTKELIAVLVLLLACQMASGEAKIDSIGMEPGYIQAGYDVELKVKVSEDLVARQIYSSQRINGSKINLQDKSLRYKAILIPKDDYSNKQAIIKEDEQYIGYLQAGETWTVTFDLKIRENTEAGNLTYYFKVARTDLNDEIAASKEIIIPIKGNVKFNLVSDKKLVYGENQLNMYLTNVGGSVARQTTVKLNNTGPVTVTGSDTSYLGDLKGTQARSSFSVYVEPGTDLGAYMMPLTITYMNRLGNVMTENFNIGVTVDAEPKIMVTAEKGETLTANKEGEVEINVINNGFVDVEFVNLKLHSTEQYTVTSNPEIYIGSLESDDTDSEEFTIKVAESVKDDKIVLKTSVSYNKEKSDKDYNIDYETVLSLVSKEELDKANGSANSTQQIKMIIFAVPGVIILYLIIWFILKLVGQITSFLNRKLFQRRRE